jgi:hypothetical protein
MVTSPRALPPASGEFGIRFESDQEGSNAYSFACDNGITVPVPILGHPGVPAVINHGRWIVECSCRSARNVYPERLWWCPACGAGAVDVVWPDDAHAICAALASRPLVNRNWRPGETVVDLLAENAAHGVVA